MARPTKYTEDMGTRAIILMTEGASLVEVAAELDITRETLNQFRGKHNEFSDAINRGIAFSEAWWQRQGRENLKAKCFQSALWYMNMKNRFKWADKHEVEHSGSITLLDIARSANQAKD